MKKNILLTIIMTSMAAAPSFAKLPRMQQKDNTASEKGYAKQAMDQVALAKTELNKLIDVEVVYQRAANASEKDMDLDSLIDANNKLRAQYPALKGSPNMKQLINDQETNINAINVEIADIKNNIEKIENDIKTKELEVKILEKLSIPEREKTRILTEENKALEAAKSLLEKIENEPKSYQNTENFNAALASLDKQLAEINKPQQPPAA